MAVKYLKNKQARRIILSRPAVEAGELGFLPGEMKDKARPLPTTPLRPPTPELIPPIKLKEYIESEVIQIAPLAFMRGRTLNDAFVILDEAQEHHLPSNENIPYTARSECQDGGNGRYVANRPTTWCTFWP